VEESTCTVDLRSEYRRRLSNHREMEQRLDRIDYVVNMVDEGVMINTSRTPWVNKKGQDTCVLRHGI